MEKTGPVTSTELVYAKHMMLACPETTFFTTSDYKNSRTITWALPLFGMRRDGESSREHYEGDKRSQETAASPLFAPEKDRECKRKQEIGFHKSGLLSGGSVGSKKL